MKNWKKKTAHLLLAASLITGIAAPFAEKHAEAVSSLVPVQLLGINDFHGALDTASKDVSGNPIGGADYLSANLDQAKTDFLSANQDATDAHSIRVQAGDMVGASPAVSGLLQDEPTMKVLEAMNFKVGTLGNHEFDEGLPEYKRILDGDSTSQFGPIVENYPRVKSNMQIVAANVVDKGTTNVAQGFKPYTIETVGGEKIGFIGIVTTEIPNLVLANYIKDYDFLDEAETVVKYAKILRDQGVNAIVVLSHVPALSSGNPTNGTGQDVAGEAANMMVKVNALDPANSVDIVLAGHNHQYTNGVVGTTRIVQSYNNGKAFSNITGQIDTATGDFVQTPDAKISYNSRSITPDASISAITKDAADRIAGKINEPIGKTANGTITKETNQNGAAINARESALGNLITDAQRYMAKKAGVQVDFAMTNNGGIRADLVTTANNEITWGAAQAVQPFGNILQVVKLDGKTIIEALNQQYLSNERYYLQISGLKYVFTDTDDLDHAYKVASVTTSDGTPLDLNKEYTVVINDFLFGGGDGFSAFTKGKLVQAIDPDTETFINYIKDQTAANKVLTASEEGRKTYKPQSEIDEENAIAAIKAVTKIDKLVEKDSFLTGITVPNAKLAVQKADIAKLTKAVNAVDSISGVSDANGAFKVDVTALDLKAGDQIVLTVTDEKNYSASFNAIVVETLSNPGENGNTSNPGGNENSGSTNPGENEGSNTTSPSGNESGTNKPTSENGSDGMAVNNSDSSTQPSGLSSTKDSEQIRESKLPSTGDIVGIASLVGILLTGISLYAFRKK
ncbi:5'-nucleotidase [Listeria floridensis FSL S10-1187]|uniref:5'-nucleotidase n=1 Tax=Listeria floridensis FSL S10-1187 TaxID=1265817 RepID=A0ABN0RD92_9LIST|nr:5'-nucleotidase [Listeria floridensis FSL S10-1187]